MVLGRPELVEAKTGVGEAQWEEDYVACLSINGNFKFDEKKRSHNTIANPNVYSTFVYIELSILFHISQKYNQIPSDIILVLSSTLLWCCVSGIVPDLL